MSDIKNICGIGYRVQEREGLVVFAEEAPIWGCGTKIIFERHEKDGPLYVSAFSPFGTIRASHVLEAHKIVVEEYLEKRQVELE